MTKFFLQTSESKALIFRSMQSVIDHCDGNPNADGYQLVLIEDVCPGDLRAFDKTQDLMDALQANDCDREEEDRHRFGLRRSA